MNAANSIPGPLTVPADAGLDIRGLIAAIVLGTLGALTIMAVPGFVMLIAGQSHLGDQQLGYVAAWDINASALTIGVASLLIARVNWRHLALAGLALMVIGNWATAESHEYNAIVWARIAAGLGEGLVIAVSFAALGRAANPDRAFGIYLIIGLGVSAAVLAGLPLLEARIGSPDTFRSMAGLTLLSISLLVWVPGRGSTSTTPGAPDARISKHLAVAGLIGVFLYFIAQGAVWSYFERIGTASGVAPMVIGEAMGISSFAGVGGALVAVGLVARFGRSFPLIASGLLSLVSFWLLRGHVSGSELIVAGIAFNFAWNLAQPLLSGLCSEADRQCRVVVAMGCIQTVGFGLGPALTGSLLRGDEFGPSLWVSAAVLVVSLAIVLTGLRVHARVRRGLASGSESVSNVRQ